MKCYGYSQDGVSLTVSVVFSFLFFFFIKKLGAQKTEIKDGYQYINKKLSLPGDIIICTPEDLVINYKQSAFSNHFLFLRLYLYKTTRTIIPWKQMFLNSRNIK